MGLDVRQVKSITRLWLFERKAIAFFSLRSIGAFMRDLRISMGIYAGSADLTEGLLSGPFVFRLSPAQAKQKGI